MKLNKKLSKEIATILVKAKRWGEDVCFRNCWHAIQLPQMQNAYYVKGWVYSNPGLLSASSCWHYWLELEKSIIDPTLYMRRKNLYFPEKRWATQSILRQRPDEPRTGWDVVELIDYCFYDPLAEQTFKKYQDEQYDLL